MGLTILGDPEEYGFGDFGLGKCLNSVSKAKWATLIGAWKTETWIKRFQRETVLAAL